MEKHFYAPVRTSLAVPERNRRWLTPANVDEIRRDIAAAPIDLTYGGWGQDGHVAYNQARRHPYICLPTRSARTSTAACSEPSPLGRHAWRRLYETCSDTPDHPPPPAGRKSSI
jgi:glucosamine-6-phosphate deaminase